MSLSSKYLHFWWREVSFFLLLLLLRSDALNSDGVSLLSFKYSILSDPLSVLESWNFYDETPCSWNGVTCTDMFGVTSLVLPDSQLLGSISEDLGMIENLRHLDLSNNFLNGSLPSSIFNASELRVLSLANNVISGELPGLIGELKSLQLLNLSDNAFAGLIPETLAYLKNLTVVSLRSNYFSGKIPSGFNSLEVLDLSSNLLNGSLPTDFLGDNLRFLNLSYNKISGTIPPEFAKNVPGNSTIDLSFNNLTGPLPESLALLNQKTEFLSGNGGLCGKPLKILCSIPSTLTSPPNITTTSSSPAIAVIPRTTDTNPETNSTERTHSGTPSGLKPATIVGIIVGDLAGVGVLAMIILLVYHQRKRRYPKSRTEQDPDGKTPILPCSCLKIKEEETSEAAGSDSDHENTKIDRTTSNHHGNLQKEVALVIVDADTKLDQETLLKASAYVLGTSRTSIVYKAVLEDQRTFVVRRIGECGVERMKDFENHVRAIAKIRHPNLVKVRGCCWGEEEKLVISDYIPNGSLASINLRRAGSSSPLNLPLEMRLKIARGIARGLAFIHEKKHVHGNLKPSNILLNSETEPIISDFGLDRLLGCKKGSARQLVKQRSQQDHNNGSSPCAPVGSSSGTQSPYQAPESRQNIQPNPKWDVYSFGILLLELLSGRVFSDRELDQWSSAGSVAEEKNRVVRMADVGIKGEMEAREDAILVCFKLGFSCASLKPQKRPSMKEALQILEKIPPATISSQ